jgi:hypothetical protein
MDEVELVLASASKQSGTFSEPTADSSLTCEVKILIVQLKYFKKWYLLWLWQG